jgi:GDPmannose 4,6-dehydratase
MNNARKVALITGVTGQDGSYLAELLLQKGYEVHGFVRPYESSNRTSALASIAHLLEEPHLHLHNCDVIDSQGLTDYFRNILPDEIYHLAAQSNTPKSFVDEWGTFQTNTHSTLSLLSIIREVKPHARFYFAASSELFGDAVESPQNEQTPFNPNSPYGISKIAGFYLTKLYREKHSLFACSGICFSHESPRRPDIFVTRKITSTVARIKFGLASELRLGNLETKRDWGFSGDFVHAIWAMLQQDKPDDYVIGTGENHSIREFVVKAFAYAGLDWEKYVVSDPVYYRPAERNSWLADTSKAKSTLKWSPKVSFNSLVEMMMENDIQLMQQQIAQSKQ